MVKTNGRNQRNDQGWEIREKYDILTFEENEKNPWNESNAKIDRDNTINFEVMRSSTSL